MVRHVFAWQLAIVTLIACLGCKPSKPSGSVTGKVQYQGESAATAGSHVYFEQSSTGYIASSEIQDDGTYSLKYQGTSQIPLGEFTVFVGPPETNLSEKEFFALKAKVDADFRRRGKKPPASPDWTLPERYYLSSTSPLRETVEQGENTINILLQE